MVTYFNKKDLTSFGNYLLSNERKLDKKNYIIQGYFEEKGFISENDLHEDNKKELDNRIEILLNSEDYMKVSHADYHNWLDKQIR